MKAPRHTNTHKRPVHGPGCTYTQVLAFCFFLLLCCETYAQHSVLTFGCHSLWSKSDIGRQTMLLRHAGVLALCFACRSSRSFAFANKPHIRKQQCSSSRSTASALH